MWHYSLSSVFSSELVSSLSSDSAVVVSGSAQSLSVRAWFRCVLQQHLHKNPDGSDSRTGKSTTRRDIGVYYGCSVNSVMILAFNKIIEIKWVLCRIMFLNSTLLTLIYFTCICFYLSFNWITFKVQDNPLLKRHFFQKFNKCTMFPKSMSNCVK